MAGGLAANAAGYDPSIKPIFMAPPVDQPKSDTAFRNPAVVDLPKGTRANVVADRIAYDGRVKVATATGLVRLTYGPYTLTATKVVYDLKNDRLKANGSVEFREPNGNILQADSAEIFNRFKEAFAHHLIALLTNDVTITADYARRYEDGITIYENVSYTACKTCVDEGGTPLWAIVAEETTHDEVERTLRHRRARFEIAGVPVLFMPYLTHPDPSVRRRSGFLMPQVKGGHMYGLGVVTPYFWAPAANYDMTFRPMLTTRQGPVADVEWRHALANGGYKIRGYGVRQIAREEPDDDQKWRGALTSEGRFKIADNWHAGWDGTVVSDKTFLRRYDFDDRDLATSQAYVVGIDGRNYFSAQALHFQTLLVDEDQDLMPTALPYVRADYLFDQPVVGGELGLYTSVYSLTRNDPDSDFDLGTEQSRAVADLHWQRQVINGLGQVITPFASLRGDVFIADNVPGVTSENETTGRFLPSAGIDMRWPFLAPHDLGQNVLTPVVQVIAAANETDVDQFGNEDAITINFDHTNLFLHDRFTGLDRYEGGTRANAGFVYSFLAQNGGFARFSFGESFHLAGDNSFTEHSGLEGPSSDLVAAVALQPWENFRFTYQTRVEEDLSDVNAQEASLSLTFDRISGSLSYASIDAQPASGRDEHEEQIWGDADYRFSEAWSLFGGLRYDLRSETFMEKTIGLAFLCDCMNAKLSYHESLTSDPDDEIDRSIRFSIEFRTLGEIGSGIGL